MLSAVALTGCGGDSGGGQEGGQSIDEVVAAVQGLSGEQRTKKLAQLAAAEGGELVLYTSSSLSYMEGLGAAFEDEFDLDVSIYKTSSEALVQRMVEEKKAGFRGSDVAETNTPGLISLADEGTLAEYSSPEIGNLVDGSVGKDWIGDKFNTFLVAWNTKRVPKGQEPGSWEDLAGPRWKGKIVIEADDSDWYKTLSEYLVKTGRTKDEVDRLFEAIARNSTFVNGHNLMAELLAAGEFDVSLSSYLHTIRELIKEGAPLAWQPALEPLISRPDGIAVVRGTRHPATALLFVDFVLDEGQKIFTGADLTPARKGLGVATTILQIPVDVPDYVAHADEWTKRYEELVRLGKVGPSSG